jgi:hypothetical protein
MKVQELIIKYIPSKENNQHEFYFDGELVENIKSASFSELNTQSPTIVTLDFEIDKVKIEYVPD